MAVDLKTRSQYSIILKTEVDGICKPPRLIKVVKEAAVPALWYKLAL